ALQGKHASMVLRNADETAKQLRKVRPKSSRAKAAAVDKAKYAQSWKDSVAKARAELGLPGNASFAKGTPLYKKAKGFHDEAKERALA
ncbi:unnamed protein product, partial [Prorocentrum cordatum]